MPVLSTFCAILLLVAACPNTIQAQQDYLGANGVLSKIDELIAKPGEKPKKDEQSILRDDLAAFSQSATNLPPVEAAKRWLELVDRAAKLHQQSSHNFNSAAIPLEADELFAVLPPPAAWADLASAVAARPAKKGPDEFRDLSLHFLAASLTGDTNGRNQEITNLEAKAQATDGSSAYLYQNLLEQLSQAMLAMADDPDVILRSLDHQLNSSGNRGMQDLSIPNLVS